MNNVVEMKENVKDWGSLSSTAKKNTNQQKAKKTQKHVA